MSKWYYGNEREPLRPVPNDAGDAPAFVRRMQIGTIDEMRYKPLLVSAGFVIYRSAASNPLSREETRWYIREGLLG